MERSQRAPTRNPRSSPQPGASMCGTRTHQVAVLCSVTRRWPGLGLQGNPGGAWLWSQSLPPARRVTPVLCEVNHSRVHWLAEGAALEAHPD